MSLRDSDTDTVAPQVRVRFYAGLNDYLSPAQRFKDAELPLMTEFTIAEVLTTAGVPLSEVDLVLVNGESAGFSDSVTGGDRLSVYPVFESLNIGPLQRLRSQPLRKTVI